MGGGIAEPGSHPHRYCAQYGRDQARNAEGSRRDDFGVGLRHRVDLSTSNDWRLSDRQILPNGPIQGHRRRAILNALGWVAAASTRREPAVPTPRQSRIKIGPMTPDGAQPGRYITPDRFVAGSQGLKIVSRSRKQRTSRIPPKTTQTKKQGPHPGRTSRAGGTFQYGASSCWHACTLTGGSGRAGGP